MLCVVTHNQWNRHFLKTDLPLEKLQKISIAHVGTRGSAAFQGTWRSHGYGAEAIRVLVEIMSDAMAPHAIREAVSQARRDVD